MKQNTEKIESSTKDYSINYITKMIKMKLLLRTKIRENSRIKLAMKEGTSLWFTEIKGI